MKLNWKKLKETIHQETKTIRELKNSGQRDSAREMKLQATRHHAIAAHARGHIHLTGRFLCNPRRMGLTESFDPCFVKEGMSREEQEKFIAKELQNFLAVEAPAEASSQSA